MGLSSSGINYYIVVNLNSNYRKKKYTHLTIHTSQIKLLFIYEIYKITIIKH